MVEGTLSSLSTSKLDDSLFIQADDIMGFTLLSFPDFVQVGGISKSRVYLVHTCWQTPLAPWRSRQATCGKAAGDSSTYELFLFLV